MSPVAMEFSHLQLWRCVGRRPGSKGAAALGAPVASRLQRRRLRRREDGGMCSGGGGCLGAIG